MSIVAKTQNLPFATDEECTELRHSLVRAGKITPAKKCNPKVQIHTDELVEQPKRRRNIADIPEEGYYKCRKIQSDTEYERRKRSYFEILQSVLRSRIELQLEFEDEKDGA